MWNTYSDTQHSSQDLWKYLPDHWWEEPILFRLLQTAHALHRKQEWVPKTVSDTPSLEPRRCSWIALLVQHPVYPHRIYSACSWLSMDYYWLFLLTIPIEHSSAPRIRERSGFLSLSWTSLISPVCPVSFPSVYHNQPLHFFGLPSTDIFAKFHIPQPGDHPFCLAGCFHPSWDLHSSWLIVAVVQEYQHIQ